MQTDHDPFLCPAEDAIEFWAIQDVLGATDTSERLHLINCPLCHELHSRFVDFYCTVNREANQLLVARNAGAVSTVPLKDKMVRATYKLLRPLDRLDAPGNHAKPVAVSHALLPGLCDAQQLRNSFISTDGTVIGKFLRLTGSSNWSFQLLSPDTHHTGRSILHPTGGGSFFQSDDHGTAMFPNRGITPSGIQSIELIPFSAEAAFDPADFSSGSNLIPDMIELDGGPVGNIVVDQEEGDGGESILHVTLAGMPRSLLEKRVIVALATDFFHPLLEEAIGLDTYFYGVDLFRSFRLWVYLR